jgi:hypothetical protein
VVIMVGGEVVRLEEASWKTSCSWGGGIAVVVLGLFTLDVPGRVCD